jgi:hypothetical protein
VVGVEQWVELRRSHFVGGVSIRELQRPTELGRNTIRRALRAERPPGSVRRVAASKLDPFKPEIQRLLREDPEAAGIRVFELIAVLGFDGGKTLVYDCLAELRPPYAPRRPASSGARSSSTTCGKTRSTPPPAWNPPPCPAQSKSPSGHTNVCDTAGPRSEARALGHGVARPVRTPNPGYSDLNAGVRALGHTRRDRSARM